MIVWNNGLISFPLIPLKGLAGTSHRVSSCYRQMQKDSAGLVLKVKYIFQHMLQSSYSHKKIASMLHACLIGMCLSVPSINTSMYFIICNVRYQSDSDPQVKSFGLSPHL